MNAPRLFAVAIATIAVGIVVVWLVLFWAGPLIGRPEQLIVALLAGLVMTLVGLWLTRGEGTLAHAGQYEKIAVWAALAMSVVSAVTTSVGLLLVLSASPDTGFLLMIGMALFLGVGIQLSMLIYALRIGNSLQELTPVRVKRETDEDEDDDEPSSKRRFPLRSLLMVATIIALGAVLVSGNTLADVFDGIRQAIVSDDGDAAIGLPAIGIAVLVIGLFMAVALGLLPRLRTLSGLLVSIGIYLLLLMFSSGFGYISYFMSSQTDEVRAIDRDNHIENETPALIRRIEEATREDVRESLIEARAGDDYIDLSDRIDNLAALFFTNQAALQAQMGAYQQRRDQLMAERLNKAETVKQAQANLDAAVQAVAQATIGVETAEGSRDRQRPGLLASLEVAEQARKDAIDGNDGTNVKECGRNCKIAQKTMDDLNKALAELDSIVGRAQASLSAAKLEQVAAEQALELAKTGDDGGSVDDPLPPPIVDTASFQQPRNEYTLEPTVEGLHKISQTCRAAADMLIGINIPAKTIPSCDVSSLEDWLKRHDEAVAAMAKMEVACAQRPEEIAADEAAFAPGAPKVEADEIPPYLQARLGWVTRCMTAANTGTPGLKAIARDVSTLESEYTTAEYDTRRVLRALFDGNMYAIFSATMAVVVDTAILFAGFFANAQRGRDLGGDFRQVAPDRLADRIRKALDTASGGQASRAARALTAVWEPRDAEEVGRTGFTHLIRVDRLEPGLRIVLDTAGPFFAPFYDKRDGSYWLLHHNLITLITEMAAGDKSAARGGAPFDGTRTPGGRVPFRPMLPPPRENRSSGNENQSPGPPDLGPEASGA